MLNILILVYLTIKMDSLPFIDYIKSDKSKYPFASTQINPDTRKEYIDSYNDFLIGESGGFLMNISFKFINTHIFTEVARTFEKNYKDPDIKKWVESLDVKSTSNRNKYYYCPFLEGSPQYNKFWERETYRRKAGMTAKCKLLPTGEIVDLHITGDHYNYLNYGRIMRTPTKEEFDDLHARGDFKTELISGFPRFWDGDYWNFKIDEFIARNKFHLTKGKARGKGFSFKRGSQAANTINSIPGATVVLASYLIDYLIDPGATASMTKTCLDWYESFTHWKRSYLSEDLEALQLGYKTKKGGSKKFGWLSKLISVSTRGNSSAAIGKRALEIDAEESGKFPNLLEFLDVTLSSTEVGASNVGTIRCYGTAGVEDADWEPFAYVFYNPYTYDMFPMENIWDDDARNDICGFFFPQIWNMEPYIDAHGNSLVEEAYKYDIEDKARKKLALTPSKYETYVGQRANKPSEAFRRGKDNLFSSPELTLHVQDVMYNKDHRYFRDGILIDGKDKLEFKTNIELEASGVKTHSYIEDVPFKVGTDLYGCIREYHPPFKIEGVVPDNLYVVLYDTVAKDKKADTIINKNSLNSMMVYMLPNTVANSRGDILVASYVGRPELMKDADRICYNLCRYYNAKALVEVNVGETINNFKSWKALNWLLKDPTYINSGKPETINTPYGVVIGDGITADNYLIDARELLYTPMSKNEENKNLLFLHYIKGIDFLLELSKFNRIGNFDRISTFRLYPIARTYYSIRNRKATESNSRNIIREIGLYGYGS